MDGETTLIPADSADWSGSGPLAAGRPTASELAVIGWLLSTTRSVRRRLDLTRPVPPDVIEACLRQALQAPSSHNLQNWHWVVVTDPGTRTLIAEAYVRSYEDINPGGAPWPRARRWRAAGRPERRHAASVAWLSAHMADVPVHVIPCLVGRPPSEKAGLDHVAAYWASIYPAVWSFQLALRSRGLGSVLTCFHLRREAEVAAVLGLPDGVTQTCLLPVAYTTETLFRPAKRVPLEQRISWNSWMGTR
jgi:nitroreductase